MPLPLPLQVSMPHEHVLANLGGLFHSLLEARPKSLAAQGQGLQGAASSACSLELMCVWGGGSQPCVRRAVHLYQIPRPAHAPWLQSASKQVAVGMHVKGGVGLPALP